MKSSRIDYWAVIQGNVEVHREESAVYDFIHKEIWNNSEQKRLRRALKSAIDLIDNNQFNALDLGAGTGNVTKKLLGLGFRVTAVDISPEMCNVLVVNNKDDVASGRLTVLNVNIDTTKTSGQYDLVTCYSVLHHLPDYMLTLRMLARLTKKGGVLFIDHEGTPVNSAKGIIEKVIVKGYNFVNSILENAYLLLHEVKVPNIDYSKSDVNLSITWSSVVSVLKREGLTAKLTKYYACQTRYETPLNILHKLIVKRNAVMLIAKKC